jgi:hypothetical protein
MYEEEEDEEEEEEVEEEGDDDLSDIPAVTRVITTIPAKVIIPYIITSSVLDPESKISVVDS